MARNIYHTDEKKMVILCLEEDLPSLPVTLGEIDDGQLWMPVEPLEPNQVSTLKAP